MDQIVSVPISALLGSGFALLVAYSCAAFSQPAKVATIWTNDAGQAQPMLTILPPLREEKNVTVRFAPPNVEQVIVCEFARISGSTAEDVVLTYLAKYPMCFSVTEVDEKTRLVRPNRASQQMKEINGQWFCMCG
jgi:hypothetical protein